MIGREVVAVRILKELPEKRCLTIAENLSIFGLGSDEFDIYHPMEQGLFLPETKAKLLSLLAHRVHRKDPNGARQLLLQAADLCVSLEDEEDRDNIGDELIRRAFYLSPCLAMEVFKHSACDGSCLRWNAKHVLTQMIKSQNDTVKWVRMGWKTTGGGRGLKF